MTEVFSAPVTYEQPKYEELKQRFSWICNRFKEKLVIKDWEPCENVTRGNREVRFEYVRLDRRVHRKQALKEMENRGLRPALYEELLGFAQKYPEEPFKFCIIALGSVVCDGPWGDYVFIGRGSCLGLHCMATFDTHFCFLAVPKETLPCR